MFSKYQSQIKDSRNSLSELTTTLTGHGRLTPFYHRFKIIADPTCTCGGGSQTAYHLLCDCKLYKQGENAAEGNCNKEWR